MSKVFGIEIGGKSAKKTSAAPLEAVVTHDERANFAYTPKLPIVNVVPSTVSDKYKIKGFVRKFAFAGIGIAAVYILIFAVGHGYLAARNNDLQTLSQQQSVLTQQSQALQPYQIYMTNVDGKRTALQTVASSDVNMGGLYKNINDASESNNITISTLGIAQYQQGATASTAAQCVNPDPFADASASKNIIGCVTINGTADNKNQVNGFLSNLQAIGGNNITYRNGFVSTFTTDPAPQAGQRGSTFTATIAFTSAVYSKKYADLSISLNDLITSQKGNTSTSGGK